MSRTRSTSSAATPTTLNWYETHNGGSTFPGYVSYQTDASSKTIVDDVTPGWYALMKSGGFRPINTCIITTDRQRVVSPFSGTVSNAPIDPAHPVIATGSFNPLACGYPMFGSFTPDGGDVDSVVIKALEKAKAPDWDLLTFMAELPQTASLLAKQYHRFNGIARAIARRAFRRETRRSRRKRRPYDPKQALLDFSSLWLEGRYGWRPLLYDIESICKALRKKAKRKISRRNATGSFTISGDMTHRLSETPLHYDTVGTRTGTCKVRAVVFHSSDMSPIGMNPLITAWEVTRYSFIVDWLIDIGAWLQAISPRVGYNELGISVSTVVDYKDTYVTSGVVRANHTGSAGGGVFEHTVKQYHRYKYVGIPLPSIQVNLNKFKVIDLIALALQGQRDVGKILKL
jgi:hypothetical protein